MPRSRTQANGHTPAAPVFLAPPEPKRRGRRPAAEALAEAPAPVRRGPGRPRKTNVPETPAELVQPSRFGEIVIPTRELECLTFSVEQMPGSVLVVHRFAEKAREQMRGKRQGKAQGPREKENPEQVFQDSLYRDSEGRYGVPAAAFRKAMVTAATFMDKLKKTQIRGTVFVEADAMDEDTQMGLVHIKGKPRMREDVTRIGRGTTSTLCYRGEYAKWSADLRIYYQPRMISREQIAGLVDCAGFSVGICEYRPERGGDWGRFVIKNITITSTPR